MNPSFCLSDFLNDVDANIKIAYRFQESEMLDRYDDETDGSIEWRFKILHLKMIYALESLGQSTLLKVYLEEVTPMLNNLTNEEWDEDDQDSYYPFASLIRRYSGALKFDETPLKADYQTELLNSILKQTSKILFDFGIVPSSESDVDKTLYNVLSVIFPDIVNKPTINQVLKNYKPDCGIPSLKTTIEYKYVNSSEKMAQWLGQINDDIRGYSGAEQWIHFYAVIYMTDNFKSELQIQAAIKSLPHNWKVLPIIGNGNRSQTSKKSRKTLGMNE